MANLDDTDAIKKLDSVNVLGSIEQLGNQGTQAWQEVGKIQYPNTYRQIQSIVFSGMGGSALGAYLLKSLFADSLPVPFDIVNDYHLPSYVSDKTLAVLASYSGTTEETLSCAKEAIAKKACVTGLTVGGALGDLLQLNNIPYYKITPTYNPSNQPRLGTGYSVFGQIALFNMLGILKIGETEVSSVMECLTKGNEIYGVHVAEKTNPAKELAQKLRDKIPIIISGEFLGHVGRVIRNQIHESAKSYSDYYILPELNHHLMEGLTNPKANKNLLAFLFLTSPLYSMELKKRAAITKDVVQKQGIMVREFIPTSQTKISQVFECIQFGAYLNYYMAMLYDVDPSKIPWVDYFKAELAKA